MSIGCTRPVQLALDCNGHALSSLSQRCVVQVDIAVRGRRLSMGCLKSARMGWTAALCSVAFARVATSRPERSPAPLHGRSGMRCGGRHQGPCERVFAHGRLCAIARSGRHRSGRNAGGRAVDFTVDAGALRTRTACRPWRRRQAAARGLGAQGHPEAVTGAVGADRAACELSRPRTAPPHRALGAHSVGNPVVCTCFT